MNGVRRKPPRAHDRVDAGAGRGPGTVLGDENLPLMRVEGGDSGVDGDLYLSSRGRRRAGGRVDP